MTTASAVTSTRYTTATPISTLPSLRILALGSSISLGRASVSVPEVADAGEDHRQAEPVGGRDHLGVAHRAAGLDHRRDAVSCAASSTPSGNGKNASEPTTVPASGSTAFIAPTFTESTRLICPAPTPTHLPGARVDDGVRLHVLRHFPAELAARAIPPRSARACVFTTACARSSRCVSARLRQVAAGDRFHHQPRPAPRARLAAAADSSSPSGSPAPPLE